MLAGEAVRHALLAGTAVGAACGLVGYLLVLRAQVFAGDALGHVAFTGALAAAAFGIDPRAGLFAACIGVALALGGLGRGARRDDAEVGIVFVWALGLGVLFLSIFATSASGGNGTAAVRVLFGSILGLGGGDVVLAVAVCGAAIVAVVALARPLLYASLDPEAAAAAGIRVRLVGVAFLAALGAVSAEATQAVGALLLLGLLAAPAGAAHRLARSPWTGMALSVALAVGAVWLGLALAELEPSLPPSTAIVSVAAGAFVLAHAARPSVVRRREAA